MMVYERQLSVNEKKMSNANKANKDKMIPFQTNLQIPPDSTMNSLQFQD